MTFTSGLNSTTGIASKLVFFLYVVAALLFLAIFYFLKLGKKFDLVLYVLPLALLVVLTEEWAYLRDISG